MEDEGIRQTIYEYVEIKAKPREFFDMWCEEGHKLPDVTGHIDAVDLHDDHKHKGWNQNNTIKLWNYNIDGRAETFTEELVFDEKSLTIKLLGLEGDVFKHFKVFIPCYKIYVAPEGPEFGCLVKASVEFVKRSEDVPDPYNYLKMAVTIAKDICAHHSDPKPTPTTTQ